MRSRFTPFTHLLTIFVICLSVFGHSVLGAEGTCSRVLQQGIWGQATQFVGRIWDDIKPKTPLEKSLHATTSEAALSAAPVPASPLLDFSESWVHQLTTNPYLPIEDPDVEPLDELEFKKQYPHDPGSPAKPQTLVEVREPEGLQTYYIHSYRLGTIRLVRYEYRNVEVSDGKILSSGFGAQGPSGELFSSLSGWNIVRISPKSAKGINNYILKRAYWRNIDYSQLLTLKNWDKGRFDGNSNNIASAVTPTVGAINPRLRDHRGLALYYHRTGEIPSLKESSKSLKVKIKEWKKDRYYPESFQKRSHLGTKLVVSVTAPNAFFTRSSKQFEFVFFDDLKWTAQEMQYWVKQYFEQIPYELIKTTETIYITGEIDFSYFGEVEDGDEICLGLAFKKEITIRARIPEFSAPSVGAEHSKELSVKHVILHELGHRLAWVLNEKNGVQSFAPPPGWDIAATLDKYILQTHGKPLDEDFAEAVARYFEHSAGFYDYDIRKNHFHHFAYLDEVFGVHSAAAAIFHFVRQQQRGARQSVKPAAQVTPGGEL